MDGMKRSASAASLRALDALNVFLADVRDGLGPYLAIYLTMRHRDPSKIGIAMSAMGVAAVAAQTPAGALIDRTRHKRVAIAAVGIGAVAMALRPTFPTILAAQVLMGTLSAIFGPAIAAIISGHTHYWQLANDGRNVAVAARSIGDPEEGPPGYLVAYFQGDDLAVAYRPAGECGPFAMITHPRQAILATGPAHVVRGPAQVRVRTWSEATVTTVRSRVDDQYWITLEVDELVGSCWSAPLHVDRLSKGEHTLAVEVCDEEGCRNVRSIRFFVDPTGRYTAVPRVEPWVENSMFC
jgi:hypothetical protein